MYILTSPFHSLSHSLSYSLTRSIVFFRRIYSKMVDGNIYNNNNNKNNFPTQKQTDKERHGRGEKTKEHFFHSSLYIFFLFKLRCYCCQNCNFHNEFQVLRTN
jgi:hypothetical protein